MDMRTFKMMWKLSEQGHPASNAFLRVPQTEYFAQEMPNEVAGLSGMPNVSFVNWKHSAKLTFDLLETVPPDREVKASRRRCSRRHFR